MPIITRPNADVSRGSWVTDGGGVSGLYTRINEVVADDTTYVDVVFRNALSGIPNQAAPSYSYTTPNGTHATIQPVWAGGIPDDYHYALVCYPNTWDQNVATPAVGYFHSYSASELNIVTAGTNPNLYFNAWLDLGWVVVVYRLGTGDVVDVNTNNGFHSFGNEAQCQAFRDIYPWLTGVMTLPSKGMFLVGNSAGCPAGLNVLRVARDMSFPIAACSWTDPAVNLRALYGTDTAVGSTIKPPLKDAFAVPPPPGTTAVLVRERQATAVTSTTITDTTMNGTGGNPGAMPTNGLAGGNLRIVAGTGEGQVRNIVSNTGTSITIDTPWTTMPDTTSWFSAAEPRWIASVDTDSSSHGHDPCEFDITLLPVIPMQFSGSYGDTSAYRARNMDTFIHRLQAAGWSATIDQQTTTGGHGITAHFQPSVMNPFLAAQL